MGRSCSQNGGRSAFKMLACRPAGKKPLESLVVDESTTLEWILKKYISIRGIGLIRLRIGIIGGAL